MKRLTAVCLCALMLLICIPVCGGESHISKVRSWGKKPFPDLNGAYYQLISYDEGYEIVCGENAFAEYLMAVGRGADLAICLLDTLNSAIALVDCKSWAGCKDDAKRLYEATYVSNGTSYIWTCRIRDWRSYVRGEIPTTGEFFDNYVYIIVKPAK